jgi:hypothetical protein
MLFFILKPPNCSTNPSPSPSAGLLPSSSALGPSATGQGSSSTCLNLRLLTAQKVAYGLFNQGPNSPFASVKADCFVFAVAELKKESHFRGRFIDKYIQMIYIHVSSVRAQIEIVQLVLSQTVLIYLIPPVARHIFKIVSRANSISDLGPMGMIVEGIQSD